MDGRTRTDNLSTIRRLLYMALSSYSQPLLSYIPKKIDGFRPSISLIRRPQALPLIFNRRTQGLPSVIPPGIEPGPSPC